MDVEVNLIGVLAAAVSSMIVGGVWYSKGVFGAEWMKLAKIDEKRAQKEAPQALAIMFVMALIASYTIAYITFTVGFTVGGDTSYTVAAVQTSLMVWLGFVAYSQLNGGVFEQRRKRLIALNMGNSLVTFVLMGLVIGWVGL